MGWRSNAQIRSSVRFGCWRVGKGSGAVEGGGEGRDSLLAFARDAVRNAAGSIFSGGESEAVGWKPSKRKSNHARMIREWRLRK